MTRAKRRAALEAARPYALLPGYADTYSTVCTFVSPAMHARCARPGCACPCHQQQSGPAWLKDATPQQVLAFLRAAAAIGLNPLAGEAYLIHDGDFYITAAGLRALGRDAEADAQVAAARARLMPDSRYATGNCDDCGQHFETLDALEEHRDGCEGGSR